MYLVVVLGGLLLGLVVGRWWTLAAALGVGLWISITTGVDEVPPWFLGAVYGALVAAGIGLGLFLYRRAGAIDPLERALPGLFRFLANRMWFDELYDWTIIAFARATARASDLLDRYFLDGLVRTAGRCPLRLAEHEVGRCLRPFELGDCGDHVLVAIQDEQEVRVLDLLVHA